jgi:hypothetical protein
MNFNAIIAVLILKLVITEDEGLRLVEHLNDKPQSTVLRDAIAAVAEVIGKPVPIVQLPMGPVGPAQQAEELAARTLPVQQPVLDGAHIEAPTEPELAANEAQLDKDQASEAQDNEAPTETNDEEVDKPASDKSTKSTSVEKSKQAAKQTTHKK